MPQVGNVTDKGKLQETSSAPDVQLQSENATAVTLTGGNLLYAHSDSGTDEQGVLSKTGWHHVVFDVSSQETSFHIPLYRMLSMLLREAMKKCSERMPKQRNVQLCGPVSSFLRYLEIVSLMGLL